MADTPPTPHNRSATAADEQDDPAPDPPRNPRAQSNGDASAGRPAAGHIGVDELAELEDDEGEDEGEQDNPATDYYALLNVPRNATVSQIRSSYHNLSLRFHPDKQPPDRRERTTAHFNNVLVAYETLMNPHDRIIYDTLGLEGLKQKWWAVGVKAMDPDEFKIWMQEQVRKHKVTEVMSLVNSRGDITIALDISGLRFREAVEVVEPGGRRTFQLRTMPLMKLTKYLVRHSFTVPLEGLGQLLAVPFPSILRGPAPKGEPSRKLKPQNQSHPTLTLAAFLGGIPVVTKNNQHTYIASPGLSAQLAHSFPAVHPSTPRCLASVLAGLDLEAASTIFPERTVSTSISKGFGSSRLTIKPIFNTSPLRKPPVIEASYVSSVGSRSSFFIQYNSGAAPLWPSATSQLLTGPPTTSHLTIGYTLLPPSGVPPVEENDDNDTPPPAPSKSHSRSKATETWRITATAGVLVGGGQLGLSWGRTFFLGTRIGAPPLLDPATTPHHEGIRVNADVNLNAVAGATFNVRVSRRIFTHTRVGVGLGVGGSSGKDVVLSLTWGRLGQKIAIPVVVAPVLDLPSVAYAALVPITAYGLLEGLYLRPRETRLRRAEATARKRRAAARMARCRRRAEEVVELMREPVAAAQRRRRERGGLVVEKALYGKEGEWADVTVAVAALMEGDQVVIARGVTKSHITGFYDPAPGEKKELRVRYLFKGRLHEITVTGSRGLVIPMRAHCIE